jgi:hypothetical protein
LDAFVDLQFEFLLAFVRRVTGAAIGPHGLLTPAQRAEVAARIEWRGKAVLLVCAP